MSELGLISEVRSQAAREEVIKGLFNNNERVVLVGDFSISFIGPTKKGGLFRINVERIGQIDGLSGVVPNEPLGGSSGVDPMVAYRALEPGLRDVVGQAIEVQFTPNTGK